ncbi:ROK family transcriptional regulator [Kribbella sp. NPDC000426]|uniref:ROK family transcriptional regulator n=1 Tax=Kribbella sp. NPDC000426 TaxID=3154255 RepID=UPI00331AA386
MSPAPTSSSRLDLPESSRGVLRRLATHGPATRPQLAKALGLSRPTMSAVMPELIDLELVAGGGSSRGATGRSAVLYSLAAGAGHVLGIEIGATRARVVAHSLDGEQLAAREQRVSARRRNVTAAAVSTTAELCEKVLAEVGDAHGPLRDVVVATSTRPSIEPVAGSLQPDGVDQLAVALPVPDSVPVIVENNVNCAAIAEHRLGAAQHQDTFVYLQVGVKIGLGIVIDGKLMHGAHGASGEVAMMPFPWTPDAEPARAGLEEYLGSEALMARCARAWTAANAPAPKDPEALFRAAARGHSTARRLVDEHAADIGRLAVGVMSVLDPGLVVLGGGVGQNQLLLPGVRRATTALAWDTEITVGALGEHATVLGAVHIAITRVLDRLT